MCPGQERVTTRLPSVAPSSTLPSASTISSATPKKGLVAEPGFRSVAPGRSEEHTSELQSLMRISYAVFCLKKKKNQRLTPKRVRISQESRAYKNKVILT